MHAAELAARSSYGRLLAMLAARTRDVAAAEDALADALLAALTQWPRDGVPTSPDAWLLTAARRKLADAARRRRVRDAHAAEEAADAWALDDENLFGDRRLELLFVCAHPAIDPALRTPLMLQTVLGLDAARIAAALRVAPKTMGQRLWRAKTKIRDAGIPFAIDGADLTERVPAVLDAIYGAYGSGWDDLASDAARARGLTEEAIWLARLVVGLMPAEPEARGLLAVLLFAESRAATRRQDGRYVPLSEQDAAGWDHAMLAEAERELASAATLGRVGPYQLEAAIQSAHVASRLGGERDDAAIALLYEGLFRLSPTLGVAVARAVALARVEGAPAGLAALDAIDPALRAEDQPYWSARAHLLAELGDPAADAAYERAIGLGEDDAVRVFLLSRRRAASSSSRNPVDPR